MTPLAGFVAAVIAGWIIRDPRRAAAAVVVPFLAVLAVQTWILASGRGDNPPSTVHGVSYWVFQAIFLAFALGITTQLAIVPPGARPRTRAGDGLPAWTRAGARCRPRPLLLVLTAAFVTGIPAGLEAGAAPQRQLAAALIRVVGILACVVSLVVLTVVNIRGGVPARGRSWPPPVPARPWLAAGGSAD